MSMEARFNMKIIEKTYNVQTGEETITEREETKSEKDLRLIIEAETKAFQEQMQTNATAKAALLEN